MTDKRTGAQESTSSEEQFLRSLFQGGELLASGKVIEAKDHLERAYELQPKNEKAQNLLGLAYFKLGLFERAAEIYEVLVRENPVDPTLRVNLGLVYLKANALQRAIREFEIATDLAPEHKKAQNYLGLALAQGGQYGRAREHFLLAGSEVMAQRMDRALAGEVEGDPITSPPKPPAADYDDSQVDQAQESVPTHYIDDQDAGGDQPYALMSDEEPPQPSGSNGHPPAANGNWNAQFGLDEAPPPSVPADEEEFRLAQDEGPSAATMDQFTSPSPYSTEPPPEFDASFEGESNTTIQFGPKASAPTPVTQPSEVSAGYLAQSESYANAEHALHLPEEFTAPPANDEMISSPVSNAVENEEFAAGHSAATAEAAVSEDQPESVMPVQVLEPKVTQQVAASSLPELAPSLQLFDEKDVGPFVIKDEAIMVMVEEEVLSRAQGLASYSGNLEFIPEMKRFRGRATDRSFGEGANRVMRVRGKGVLVFERGQQHFLSLDLGDESVYFREPVVFAFQERVMFENGRVPSETPPDLDLVHLRGTGKVLLALGGPLRTLEVQMSRPVTLPLQYLVGWHGNITPRMLVLPWETNHSRAGVELQGEGFALFASPLG